MEFILTPKCRRVAVFIDPKGNLHVDLTYRKMVTTQGVYQFFYFVKLYEEPLSWKTYKKRLVLGKLVKGPAGYMGSFLHYVQGILLPFFMAFSHGQKLIANGKVRESSKTVRWPEDARRDFEVHLNKLAATLTEYCAQCSGDTKLYIPQFFCDLSDEATKADKDIMQRYLHTQCFS